MRSPFNNLFSDFSNFRLVYRDNFWKIRKSHRMVKTDGKNPWFPDISGEDFPEPILNPALARDEEGDFGPRRLRLRGPSGWRARATWHQRRHGVTVGNVGKAENGGGKGWKKSGWRGKHAWCLVDFFWRSMVKMDDGGLEKGGFEQRECGFELKKRGYKLNCENPAWSESSSVTLYWKILVHCIGLFGCMGLVWLHRLRNIWVNGYIVTISLQPHWNDGWYGVSSPIGGAYFSLVKYINIAQIIPNMITPLEPTYSYIITMSARIPAVCWVGSPNGGF